MKKQRYVPDNFQLVLGEEGSTAIYHADAPVTKRFSSMRFVRKKSKPTDYYYYPTAEQRDAADKKFLENQKQIIEHKAKRRAEAKQPHTLVEGDILYCSWGYEQTNVDFYKVTKVLSKHFVEICKISHKSVESTGWASDTVVADPETVVGPPMRKKANNTNSVRLSSFEYAMKYDGKPLHRSWYA